MIKKSFSKKIIIGALCAGLALIAILVIFTQRKQKNTSSAKSPVSFTVRKETFENLIEIAGTVSAANEQRLQTAGTGSVTAVYVREGERVKKGDVILQLDDPEQRYNLAKHLYDMDQKKISGSPRELELMKAQQAVLEQRLRDRKVIANFDGVIAKFSAKVGSVYEAKDEVGVIIDRSYLSAVVEVVESDAPKLTPGQKVYLSFPALPSHNLEGYVVSFPSVGKITARGATVVEAEIRVNNPPDEILPYYSFTGNIEISAPSTVLLVEREVIEYKDGKSFAEKILPGGEIERIDVEVTPFGRNFVSVQSGLSEGDTARVLKPVPVSGTSAANAPAQSAVRISVPGARR